MQTAAMNIDLVRHADARTQLGESPVWDPETEDIWWIDIDGRRLLRRTDSALLDHWDLPETPGFVVLAGPDQPAIGMQTGIFLFTPDKGQFERILAFDAAGMRFNDAMVDAHGRLWASTIALDASPGQAAIHRVTPSLTLETVIADLSIPNGLAVDMAAGRLYYSDSHPDTQTIWWRALADDGTLSEASTVFATTHDLAGRPDGAGLDGNGHYWIAGVDGGALYVFAPSGGLAATLPLPFPCPTKLAFFGTAGNGVCITSKAVGNDGGYLALASLPADFAGGVVQPYWTRFHQNRTPG